MKKKVFFILIAIILLTSNFSIAHKGRTDKYGGHYKSSTGYYHYHSGKYKNTGEYTAPIEEGGTKVESEENTGGLIINEGNNVKDELKEENNKLKNELHDINSKIYNMNATSINDIENIIQEQQKEIKNLKEGETEMLIMFAFCMLLAIYISYAIGNNRK